MLLPGDLLTHTLKELDELTDRLAERPAAAAS
jgi:hypothetical protein